METVDRTFSEFLRQPNDVVAELAERNVLLRRRNAPTLRLSRADHYDDRSKAMEALARLLRNLATYTRLWWMRRWATLSHGRRSFPDRIGSSSLRS